MLSDEQINQIHHLHWHQKWSLRQIARHLNLNRRTVAKYFIQPAQPRPRLQRTSKLEPFHAAIGELLEQDPDASAVVILQRLRGRGFDGGITILKDYLHQVRTEAAARRAYVRVESLLNQLTASQVDHSLVRKLKFYTDPALLICDELGYLALDQQTSNLFYQVISSRHGLRRSTIITTNTAFSEWGNILHNTTIATAIADRLVENSEVFLLAGDSLRKAQKNQSPPPP